jgi:hypothetical protein
MKCCLNPRQTHQSHVDRHVQAVDIRTNESLFVSAQTPASRSSNQELQPSSIVTKGRTIYIETGFQKLKIPPHLTCISTPTVYTIFLLPSEAQTACLARRAWSRRLASLRSSSILKNLPLSEDVLVSAVVDIGVVVLCLALEQFENVLHRKLSDGLAALDSGLCKLALGFLELEDTLFDTVVD